MFFSVTPTFSLNIGFEVLVLSKIEKYMESLVNYFETIELEVYNDEGEKEPKTVDSL